MKRKILIALTLCITFVVFAGVDKPVVSTIKYKKITLKNNFLSVDILPESMGRIDQICYLPTNYSILYPRHMVKTEYGTLLKKIKGNEFGSCDSFVHRDLRSRENAMKMEQIDDKTVIFTAKNYGGEPVTLTRKISLSPTGSLIRVTSKIQWHGKDNMLVTPRWDFFLNGGDPLPSRRNLFIPIVRLPKKNSKYDSIVTWQQRNVIPSDNFLAVAIPPKKLSFALIIDKKAMGKNGKFYTLSSGYNNLWYWWMSFMLEPQKMSFNGIREYSFNIAVFPNYTDIKEICSDVAMRCYVTKSTKPWILGLVLAPSEAQDASKIHVILTEEKTNKKYEKVLPLKAFVPGKQTYASWTLHGIPAGKYHVSGNIPGKGYFDFSEPIIEIKDK